MGDENRTTIDKAEGLRDLADYIEQHPDALDRSPVRICAEYAFRRETFIKAAARLGPRVEVVQQGDRVNAVVRFGEAEVYATIGARELAGPPVLPEVDTAALAREIAAARQAVPA